MSLVQPTPIRTSAGPDSLQLVLVVFFLPATGTDLNVRSTCTACVSGVVCGGAVVCSTYMWCGGCNYVVVMLFVPSREHYQHQVTHKYKSLQHGNNRNVGGISFASC